MEENSKCKGERQVYIEKISDTKKQIGTTTNNIPIDQNVLVAFELHSSMAIQTNRIVLKFRVGIHSHNFVTINCDVEDFELREEIIAEDVHVSEKCLVYYSMRE